MIAKGHNPPVNDPEIEDAMTTMNMLDSGVQIPIDEISVKEIALMGRLRKAIHDAQQDVTTSGRGY